MKIRQIFLDIDGVLADWTSAVVRLHGREPEEVFAGWKPGLYDLNLVLGISNNEMWEVINARGHDFWAQLKPYPWARSLLQLCQDTAPTTLLTSTSLDPVAASGKVAWIQKIFGRRFRDFLIGTGKSKPSVSREGVVLVDDNDVFVDDFVDAGGSAILFPRIWNTDHERADFDQAGALEIVSGWLAEIEGQ